MQEMRDGDTLCKKQYAESALLDVRREGKVDKGVCRCIGVLLCRCVVAGIWRDVVPDT